MLTRQPSAHGGDIGIDTFLLLIYKCWEVVPVTFQGICNFVCNFGISEFQDRVVVHGPILSLLVFAPKFLSFNAKDLHTNTTGSRDVVWKELGCQGGIAHDDIVGPRLLEHALGQVCWQIVVDFECAHYALKGISIISTTLYEMSYSLSLQMGSS